MERLRGAYIVVAQERSEFLDLLGGDFNGIVHNSPNDTLMTGWSGKGPEISVVSVALRQEIHRIESPFVVMDDFTYL